MATFSTAKAREHFAEILNRVAFGKERQILIRRGKEIAAMIPIEDLHWLERLEDQQDLEEARSSLKKLKKIKTKSFKRIKEEAGI